MDAEEKTGPGGGDISSSEVGEQLRQWSRSLQAEIGVEPDEAVARLYEKIHPCVTFSREAGAGATLVAKRIGEILQFETVDRQLLDQLAERFRVPRDMLEIVDERVSNWVTEAVGMWLAHRMLSQSEYMELLGRFVLMSASSASLVFVGRGVQFILPREKCLAIRVVAPLEQRISRIMSVFQLSRDEAKRYASERDASRGEFVRRKFRCDVADAHLYDLVINTEHVDVESAVDIIIGQWRKRFGA
jgi:cytidylate kinase